MRIGIVGAENSHCAQIAKTLNVDKDVPDCEVTHVWGETPEFAAKAAEEGSIPTIVENYTDMIGAVDGVVLDHRDGADHLPAARPFVEAGIPVFVDKPFCTDLDEGIKFVRLAREKGVPITSYSVLSLQMSALKFAQELGTIGQLRSLVTAGPVDIDSEYSGVFFYAIHQVDLICSLIDAAPLHVTALRRGDDGIASISFESGPLAVVNCLKDWYPAGFLATAYGDEKVSHSPLPFDDKTYLAGIRRFCDMFASGKEPAPPASYLRPVAILQAMRQSFDSGESVAVAPVPEF